MGRLPNSGSHSKKKQPHFEDKRRRHRNADCKYRSKVQYLYFKIRSFIKKKTAKDGLLDNALGLIQNLETQICEALGSDYVTSCRKEFLNFLEQEEALWKKEKDVTKWWSNVEDLLKKKQPLDLSVKESIPSIESEVIKTNDCGQHAKSSKLPYRKSLISSKKQKNKSDLKHVRCCCSENDCGYVSYNEGFQRDIDTCNKKRDDFSSTSWNAPEVPHFSSIVLQNSKGTKKNFWNEEGKCK